MKNPQELPSYAEQQNMPVVDWMHELSTVSPKQKERLRNLAKWAGDWPTCAVGNQCFLLERDPFDGAPKDPKLHSLGGKFVVWVHDMECSAVRARSQYPNHSEIGSRHFEFARYKAMKTLEEIENRSVELLKELA